MKSFPTIKSYHNILFAGRCLAENPKNLKIADKDLSTEILKALVALEISGRSQVNSQLKSQVFEILCSLSQTAFEVEALEMLENEKDSIEQERMQQYRIALGKGKSEP